MRRLRGFTIIELLVTITIIGLLLAAAGIGIARSRVAGRDAERVSDILQIARAIDQAALANRGTYPTGPSYGMVADRISSALDLSAFTGRKIPADPLPATSPSLSECTSTTVSFVCGYVYWNRTGTAGQGLARSQSTQYEYVLETGLEGERFVDEQAVTAGPAGRNASAKRTQFLYAGKSCGAGAAANTCSLK